MAEVIKTDKLINLLKKYKINFPRKALFNYAKTYSMNWIHILLSLSCQSCFILTQYWDSLQQYNKTIVNNNLNICIIYNLFNKNGPY